MSTHRKSKSHRIEWKEETLLQSVETHSAEAGPAKHRHCVPPLKTKRQRLLWKKSSSWVYTDAAFIPSSEKSGRSFPADRWMLIDLPSVDEFKNTLRLFFPQFFSSEVFLGLELSAVFLCWCLCLQVHGQKGIAPILDYYWLSRVQCCCLFSASRCV